MENKWHNRFFEMAKLVSTWSKDPSSKTGAVIVDKEHRVLSVGYNGFSRGVDDDANRYENRETKYEIVVHAEVNAALNALGKDLKDAEIYLHPYPPCSRCASVIIQSGIKKVYVKKADIPERWQKNISLSETILKEAGVSLEYID